MAHVRPRREREGGAPGRQGTATIRLVQPSLRGVVRIVTIVPACAVALYLVWPIRSVVRLVGISLFLALALVAVIDALAGRIRVPRALLILIVR